MNVSRNQQPMYIAKEYTLMMEALSSSETSVLTRAIGRNIAEDAILLSYRRENLKSYNVVPSSLILVTRATRRTISKNGSLHSHRIENLKSY
jgi:hypothetical protein